ncbi:MAG: hypothetical protein JKX68_01495, partial [Flavobacteriales bacterium]|nr:hypothetical protein [Flavobacteriales bacterium]
MENKENIEFKKLISEKYDGYAPPPSEELWDKVYVDIANLKVSKFKKRAAYYKWLSLGLLLLLIGGGILYQFKDENKIVQLDSEEVLSNNEQDNENVTEEENTTKAITNETTQPNESNEANQLIVKQESEQTENNTPRQENNTANISNESIEDVLSMSENTVDEVSKKKFGVNDELVEDNTTLNLKDKNETKNISNELSTSSETNEEENNKTDELVGTEKNEKEAINNSTLDEKSNVSELTSKDKDVEQVNFNTENSIVDSLTGVIADLNEQLNNQDSISDKGADTLDIANKPDSATVPPVISEKTLS